MDIAKVARGYEILHYLPRPLSKDDIYNLLILLCKKLFYLISNIYIYHLIILLFFYWVSLKVFKVVIEN
jgi:hypothetical protein